jgi:hypothetical protein
MRFADAELPEEAQPELPLGLEKNDLLRIGEYLALLILATLVLLLVVSDRDESDRRQADTSCQAFGEVAGGTDGGTGTRRSRSRRRDLSRRR